MKRFLKLALVLAAFVILTGAVGPKHAIVYIGQKVTNQGLDAARSFELENIRSTGSWGLMTVFIQLTDADNSTTALNMSCTGSFDNNTTDFTLQSCSTGAGVCTSSDASWTKNPSAISSPKKWVWRVDVEGVEDVECTFTDTGGVAADKLDVYVSLATKG